MIIGLYGEQGVGKTTLARQLRPLGYEVESFAEPIKQMAKPIEDSMRIQTGKEDVDPDQGFSRRHLYQTIGTEVGRHLNPDLWVNLMALRTENKQHIVIDDCRFDNEKQWVEDQGGVMVYIDSETHKQEQSNDHTSEQDWLTWPDAETTKLFLNNGIGVGNAGDRFRVWVLQNFHN